MEKRITFRITFEEMTLSDAAELEEKIEAVLEEYGQRVVEIQAMPTIAAFIPRQMPAEE